MDPEKRKQRPLSVQLEMFVQALVRGMSGSEAMLYAYPERKTWKPDSLKSQAYKLIHRPNVKARYDELLEEFRNREREKTGWTREQSIQALKFVIDSNKKDVERIYEAYEQELEELQKQIEQNPELAQDLLSLKIKQRKKLRSTITNNNGIIAAVAELNKMQGYNEQNVNMNGMVVFQGDDNLED